MLFLFGSKCRAAGFLLLQTQLKHFFGRDCFDVAHDVVDGQLRFGNRAAYNTHQRDDALLHGVATFGSEIRSKDTLGVQHFTENRLLSRNQFAEFFEDGCGVSRDLHQGVESGNRDRTNHTGFALRFHDADAFVGSALGKVQCHGTAAIATRVVSGQALRLVQVPKRQIVDLRRKGRGGNEAERTDVKIAFVVGRIAVGGKRWPVAI